MGCGEEKRSKKIERRCRIRELSSKEGLKLVLVAESKIGEEARRCKEMNEYKCTGFSGGKKRRGGKN